MDKVLTIFSETLDVEQKLIDDNTSPANLQQWDSLASVRLVLALEAEFQIRLSGREIMLMNSVGEAKKVLRSKGVPLD